jgi:hypothetical protein
MPSIPTPLSEPAPGRPPVSTPGRASLLPDASRFSSSPFLASILVAVLLSLIITGAFLTIASKPANAAVPSAATISAQPLRAAVATGSRPHASLSAPECTSTHTCLVLIAAKCTGPDAPTEQQLIGCPDYTITGRPYAPTNSGNAQWNNLFTTFGAIFGLAGPGPAAESKILSRLSASGAEIDPADAGGQLTRAGRAYAKASEVFGPTSGNPPAINRAGQSALKTILYDKDTVLLPMTSGRFQGGSQFVLPDGIGAVFSRSGTLQYFGRFAR